MSLTKPEPKAGEPCPQCGSAFRLRPQPSAEQRAAAANRENPVALPAHVDTATEAQITELGALYVCSNADCKYRTRIRDAAPRDRQAGPQPDAHAQPGETAPAAGATVQVPREEYDRLVAGQHQAQPSA